MIDWNICVDAFFLEVQKKGFTTSSSTKPFVVGIIVFGEFFTPLKYASISLHYFWGGGAFLALFFSSLFSWT